MRILIIPGLYPVNSEDATGSFIREQARALSLRHDVTVMTPQLITLRTLLRRRSIRPSADTSEVNGGARGPSHLTVPIYNLTNRNERLTHSAWRRQMRSASLRHFSRTTPDLIHAHFARPAGGAALPLARAWDIPLVVTEHSGPFSVQVSTEWRRQRTMEALRNASRVIAVSPFLAQEIRAALPGVSPTVVGNVVDEDYFCPGPAEFAHTPGRPFRFLFVGGLTWHKGLVYLLDAARQLVTQEHTGWEIVIVGNGPDRPALQRAARDLIATSHVNFVGNQARAAVRGWMRSADALVLPSIIETFGVVLIEAMACGLPVVATDCGGPRWVVPNGSGRMVRPRDATALAAALAETMTRNGVAASAQIRDSIVRRFGRSAWMADMDRVYREVTKTVQ